MPKRSIRQIEDLTPEQRAVAEWVLAKNRTPERREELARMREEAMREVPPLKPPTWPGAGGRG